MFRSIKSTGETNGSLQSNALTSKNSSSSSAFKARRKDSPQRRQFQDKDANGARRPVISRPLPYQHHEKNKEFAGAGEKGRCYRFYSAYNPTDAAKDTEIHRNIAFQRVGKISCGTTKEIAILKDLHHPNIIKYIDNRDGLLVMEYGGENIESLIKHHQIKQLKKFLEKELKLSLDDFYLRNRDNKKVLSRMYFYANQDVKNAYKEEIKNRTKGKITLRKFMDIWGKDITNLVSVNAFSERILTLNFFKNARGESIQDIVRNYIGLKQENPIDMYKDQWNKMVLDNNPSPFTFFEEVGIFFQIVDAVRYLHDHETTHSDLSNINITLKKDGTAKLIDFGSANSLEIGMDIIQLQDILENILKRHRPQISSCSTEEKSHFQRLESLVKQKANISDFIEALQAMIKYLPKWDSIKQTDIWKKSEGMGANSLAQGRV